jgi:drug/metabolite transporter (DMT)-like permease
MSRRGVLLFAAMCLIWGIPYLLIKVAVEDLSPSMLVLARTSIAAVILLPIALFRRELRPLVPHWLPLLAFAAIEIALPWVLLGAAETKISSSLTALLIATVPLVATLIALTTGDRERPDAQTLLGLLVGMAGVAAIVGVSVEGGVVPIVQVILVAICYAVGPVILQRWLAALPALGVIAASLAVTAVAYVPIVLLGSAGEAPSAEAVGAVLGLAIACTALAFLLFFALIHEVGPGRATVITYVNPVVAVSLGVILLGENVGLSAVAGLLLILAGSWLSTGGRMPPGLMTRWRRSAAEREQLTAQDLHARAGAGI